MKMKRLTIAILASVILLSQLSGAAGLAASKPRIVALNGVTGLGLAQLFGSGAYEIEVGKAADVAIARLTTGAAEAAALPVSTAALIRNKGVPVVMAAITNYGSLYVVSKGNKGLYDQAASSIGVPGKGTMPDVVLAMLLADKKASSAGVQYYASPVELANLLAAGKVEAAILPEPWVSQVLASDAALKITSDIQAEWKALFGFDYPLSCVVMSESFVKERPEDAKKMLADIKASVAWVKANPEKASAIAEANLSMGSAATVAAVPRCNFEYLDGSKAKSATAQFYGKVLQSVPAMIGGKLPDEAFYLNF